MLNNSNFLLMPGGAITVRVAVLLDNPVPPSFDWGGLVTLFFVPAVIEVTFTVSVQEEPGGRVPPPKLRKVSPGVAFQVPLQVTADSGRIGYLHPGRHGVAEINAGQSNRGVWIREREAEVETPFSGMVVGEKLLVMVGGLATVSVAVLLAVPSRRSSN